MDADLTSNIGTIRFQFERSEIIDRDPPKPGEPVTLQAQVASMAIIGDKVTLHLQRSKYRVGDWLANYELQRTRPFSI